MWVAHIPVVQDKIHTYLRSHLITKFSNVLLKNEVKEIILKSSSLFGLGTFFRGIPCSVFQLAGQMFFIIIFLKIFETGVASSEGKFSTNTFGRSQGTPDFVFLDFLICSDTSKSDS
jgi:hypothetical protein